MYEVSIIVGLEKSSILSCKHNLYEFLQRWCNTQHIQNCFC